jgi:hypothetical protein
MGGRRQSTARRQEYRAVEGPRTREALIRQALKIRAQRESEIDDELRGKLREFALKKLNLEQEGGG